MDYKYINQLLERYWSGETSLEEEKILRTFFSQADVPAELMRYKDLFAYEWAEKKEDTLSDDFDRKLMSAIAKEQHPHARVVSLTSRLKPLFKAAAIVAMVLTLGNAAQVSLNSNSPATDIVVSDGYKVIPDQGTAVVRKDSMSVDSLQRSKLQLSTEASEGVFIK